MDLMREQNIQSAINTAQNSATLRHAAQEFNVPQSTLSDHLRGVTNRLAGQIKARKLLPVQDRFLIDWALNEEATRRTLAKAQIIRMA